MILAAVSNFPLKHIEYTKIKYWAEMVELVVNDRNILQTFISLYPQRRYCEIEYESNAYGNTIG